MTRISALRPEFVEYIPETVEDGVLYISKRHATAVHKCCCGCGTEVPTPLKPTFWRLTENASGEVSLFPSVGNWSLPCKAHYVIKNNCVIWARQYSAREIRKVKARDNRDHEKAFPRKRETLWKKLMRLVRGDA